MERKFMAQLRSQSLQMKLIVVFGLGFVVSTTALVLNGLRSSRSVEEFVRTSAMETTTVVAKERLVERAQLVGRSIRAELQLALDCARTTALTLGSLKPSRTAPGPGRAEVQRVLKSLLLAHGSLVGTYSCWEPNAFDGNDSAYRNTPGHDASGRFIPYWSRGESGEIRLEPLLDYESHERYPNGVRKGEYYLLARETGKERAIDPYPYPLQGTVVWMTSLVVPIFSGQSFSGIAGVDVPLDFIQTLADAADRGLYDGTGTVVIVTRSGLLACVSERPDLVGRPLADWSAADADDWLASVRKGEVRVDERGSRFRAVVPLSIGGAVTPWTVLVEVPKDAVLREALELGARMRALERRAVISQVLVGVAVAALGLVALWFFARTITRSMRRMNVVAGLVADGELDRAEHELAAGREASSHVLGGETDEISQLTAAFRQMTAALASLIGQVQRSGIQVTTAATEIAASARELESTVTEQAASTSEVTTASRQIFATARELAGTMDSVAAGATTTAALAGDSETGLKGMAATMSELIEATGSISTRLGAISERANAISSIVTTITKVADQTNLLSLNAAIEAEKAGEYGRGFSVVAREIRRLADQTAVATLDIERMVKEMHSAVSSGVMEMDKFIERVRRGAEEVRRIGGQLGNIIDQVQALTPRFETVREGMVSQQAGADQITEALRLLAESNEQTKGSLRDFNRAAEQLTEAVTGLRTEVSRFKVA